LRKFFIPIVLLLGIFSAIAAFRVNNNDLFFLIKKNFTLFSEVYNEISLRYVDEVNPELLMRRGLNAMLQTLDPYTVLFDESQNQQMSIITTGNYAGVGLDVGARDGQLVVLSTADGYPAQKRGIRPGDIITAVNGFRVENLSPEELETQLMGEVGSKVVLSIQRYGMDQMLEFELIRERIEIKNITYSGLLPGSDRIGYVAIARFGQGTSAELRTAIEDMLKDGSLDGFILDLRNNPGGLLDEGVKTINKFIGPGVEVVRTQGRTPDTRFSYLTEEPALLPQVPLIILQDEGSASSSEIVAGAIQDLDRGVIIGSQSFGKGLVQIIRPLSYDISMKITVSKYYIPSGRSIQSTQYISNIKQSPFSTKVPDSLKIPFKTLGGRTVYDGTGIQPDIEMKKPIPSMVETALLQNNKYFLYATQTAGKHKADANTPLSDLVFDDFVNWLKRDGFNFTTQSEQLISDLEGNLTQVGLSNGASSQIKALRTLVQNKKDSDLRTYKASVKQELHEELASRDGGSIERLKVRLIYDPVLKKALEVLNDKATYQSILRPNRG
jgi:carboxyl-terminal processing protease